MKATLLSLTNSVEDICSEFNQKWWTLDFWKARSSYVFEVIDCYERGKALDKTLRVGTSFRVVSGLHH